MDDWYEEYVTVTEEVFEAQRLLDKANDIIGALLDQQAMPDAELELEINIWKDNRASWNKRIYS
jgi:hypothetical protein